jgi:hypothetical protein
MTRSKLSVKAILLTSGIGLAVTAFGGFQPAAAQSYSNDYSCLPRRLCTQSDLWMYPIGLCVRAL